MDLNKKKSEISQGRDIGGGIITQEFIIHVHCVRKVRQKQELQKVQSESERRATLSEWKVFCVCVRVPACVRVPVCVRACVCACEVLPICEDEQILGSLWPGTSVQLLRSQGYWGVGGIPWLSCSSMLVSAFSRP